MTFSFVRSFASVSLAFVLSVAASAHDLSPIAVATDAKLEAARAESASLAARFERGHVEVGAGGGTVFVAYRVDEVSPKKPGEAIGATVARVVKFALHRDYPITGDEGGYFITRLKAGMDLDRVLADRFVNAYEGEEAQAAIDRFQASLLPLLDEPKKFIVLSVQGSGNNTIADIIVAYDVVNAQFFYIMDSNFGSDG